MWKGLEEYLEKYSCVLRRDAWIAATLLESEIGPGQ